MCDNMFDLYDLNTLTDLILVNIAFILNIRIKNQGKCMAFLRGYTGYTGYTTGYTGHRGYRGYRGYRDV